MSIVDKSLSAVIWSGADVFMRQGLQFFVSILLARLLSPEDFGLVAMLSLFTGIAGSFIDSGFSSALIQRQDITSKDESTVFFFNMGIGVFVTLMLFLIAPLIGSFFGQESLQQKVDVVEINLPRLPWITIILEFPILETLTYIMALNLFIGSCGSIQNVLLIKKLNFKILMKIGSIATLLSGILAVVLAWKGFGVWSLAIQTLASTFITTVLLWCWNPWRPELNFSLISLRSMFRFGGFMLLSGLLDTVYTKLYSLIIGKLFNARELGFYSRADSLQQLPVSVLTTVFNRVAFPVFSSVAYDKEQLAQGMRKVLPGVMLFNIPVMLGLMIVAEPLVIALIGEKWRPSVPILQVLCIAGVLWPLHVINLNVLMAQGYSNLFFRIEILKKVIGIIVIMVACLKGVMAIAWSQVIVGAISFLINAHYTGVFLGYSAWKQILDILPYLAVSLLMVGILWLLHIYLTFQPPTQLMLMVGSGVIIYLLSCYYLRLAAYHELLKLLIQRFKPLQNLP